MQPLRQRGVPGVLGGAAERHEEVVVVGVHRRAAPRQVGQDRDALRTQHELPALGVVARRGERREADEFGGDVEPGAAAGCRRAMAEVRRPPDARGG